MSQEQQQQQQQQEKQQDSEQKPQQKISALRYIMNVKSDSSVNQGFNRMLAECSQFYDIQYDEYMKKNKNIYKYGDQIPMKDENDQPIYFTGRDSIIMYCSKVSASYVEKHFKEHMDNHRLCREQCESQYEQGFINFFYRENCYKQCRISMDKESKPLVKELFVDKKVYNID